MREDIRYFHNTKPNQPFVIDMAGISYCDGSYIIERRKNDPYGKDLFVLEYVVDGTGTVIVDGEKFTASRYDVYLVPKGTDHVYYSDDKEPWEKIFFNIKGTVAEKLISAYGLQKTVVFKNCSLRSDFMKMYNICLSELGQQEIFNRCTLKFHDIIRKLHDHIKLIGEHSNEATILKQYLDENVHRNVSINELSDKIYRSKDYIIKLFKREYGETPYNYLLRQKIEASKNYLKNTTLSIKQIAEIVGYDDQHYFSNLFKKFAGVSPRAYRQNERKEEI